MSTSEFVPPGLTKEQTRRSLVTFNWNLVFRAVFETVCGGPTFIFVAFALSLGIAEEKIGVVASAVSWACIVQMLGLPVVSRMRDRKKSILVLGLLEPMLMMAGVAVVPWLAPGWRLAVLTGAVFTAAASLNMSRPLTEDWLATVLPAGLRGRYLGRRFQYLSGVMIATTLIVGWVADELGRDNTVGLGYLLTVGGLFGVLSVLVLRRATMPGAAVTPPQVRFIDLVGVLRTREFRRFLAGVLLYNLPFFVPVPFYQVFNLETLEMSKRRIAYMMAGYFAIKIVTLQFWRLHADRLGPRRMLALVGPSYVGFFGLMAVASAQRPWPAFAAWWIAALGDGAYLLATQMTLYRVVPVQAPRPAYFAVSNLITFAAFGVGALVAVPILQAMGDVSVEIGPLTLGRFHLLFAASAALMIPCLMSAVFFPGPDRGKALANQVP